MGSVNIDGLMEGFSSLLHQANPAAVPEFMAWVDEKVSEYKRSSYRLAHNKLHSSYEPCNTEIHFNNSQLAKDMNRLKTLISDSNQNKLPSQVNSKNLSPVSHGTLAALLSANYASPSSSLTLKVPCVSPTQHSSYYGCPESISASPQTSSTPAGAPAGSSLKSLFHCTARVNLSQEFDDSAASDGDSSASQDDGAQGRTSIDCHLCGKVFLHRSSYRRHMKLHQGVFTHHCGACDRKFTRKEHFQRHKCFQRQKSFIKGRNDLDSSFDSVSHSPVKSEWGFCERSQVFCLPEELRPLDMSSKVAEEEIVDAQETNSVSSGQISPAQGSECSKRAARKSTAPRKLDSNAFHESDDYMSDIDESMYDPRKTTEDGVIDMSMKKEAGLIESMTVDKSQKTVGGLEHSSLQSPGHAVSMTCESSTGRGFGVPSNDSVSPPPGFRIGDLIENTVTKYHSALERAKVDVPFLSKSYGTHSAYASFPSSPKMKAKMYAKMYAAGESNEVIEPLPQVEEGSQKGNFLATETGTYQITTEQIEKDNVLVENTTSKVIKVVKQGNYLKLKKEAQLIDGELRFICPHCCKVFHRSSNFSRHMRIHRGVYSYICSTCSRGFYRKEHYDKHKCYRKSMATTWQRKTKVDLDRSSPEKCDKENDCLGVIEDRHERDGAVNMDSSRGAGGEDAGENSSTPAHAE